MINQGEVVVGRAIALEDIPRGGILDVVVSSNGVVCARTHAPEILDMDAMTWSCMVCGTVRPDAQISVAKRMVPGLEDMFPLGACVNVRFCNDRPECSAAANTEGVWPVPGAAPVAGRCDPATGLHSTPHRGCVLR